MGEVSIPALDPRGTTGWRRSEKGPSLQVKNADGEGSQTSPNKAQVVCGVARGGWPGGFVWTGGGGVCTVDTGQYI